jgi:4-hydroxy-3-polyprenylbenzoate decarboxylase
VQVLRRSTLVHLAPSGFKLGIPASYKWPPETKCAWGTKIRMSDEIIERVTARWPDYRLPGSGCPIWK